jgi:ATP-dependent Clp protease protease subunit
MLDLQMGGDQRPAPDSVPSHLLPYLAPVAQRGARSDYARQRQMTLGDLLLENRIIFLAGVINEQSAINIVMQMLYLQYENRSQDIHFYVSSPGGTVTGTLAIYDTMQFLECPVATYCVGMAASGGAILLAGGAKGKRFALPHSKVMIHQPHGGIGGQVSDIEIQAAEIEYDRKRLNDILAKHTGQPYDVIARETERDRYFHAAAAKEFGLVDDILLKPPPEEKKPG